MIPPDFKNLHSQQNYEKILEGFKNTFSTGKTLSYEFRLKQLKCLRRMLIERQEEILEAINKDLRKPKIEAIFYEIEFVKVEILNALRDLKDWMKPKKVPINLLVMTDRAEIRKDPYGVVLIIGAWNFPFMLTMIPLCGAIAGGNCVIVKPSEVASHCAAKIAQLIPQYLDPECYKIIEGGVEETTILLQNRFDYIFATGSTKVGKAVMAAAAKYLTPVTLELGGKSPCYVEDGVDIAESAKRIFWGKLLNTGQSCIAPDYILCSKKTEELLIVRFKKLLQHFYGTGELQSNGDYGRIINKGHFERLKNLISDTKGDLAIGSDADAEDLYVPPTVIVNVKETDVLMQDEIFGPILPILTCNSPEEALRFINSRPKPLGLYVFTKKKAVMNLFKERSSSGGLIINDVCVHSSFDGLPFGGVGDSGMGAYHWRYSLDTFVHQKAVLTRDFGFYAIFCGCSRYPPFEFTNIKTYMYKYGLPLIRMLNLPTLPKWPRQSILFKLCLAICWYYLLIYVFCQ